MTAYELDDELVGRFIRQSWIVNDAIQMAGQLEKQFPVPAPTKLGAVVQTESRVLVRTAAGVDVQFCWWDVTNHVGWFSDDQLGRIVEVLSEGVDV